MTFWGALAMALTYGVGTFSIPWCEKVEPMQRFRSILGLIAGLFMILSSAAHSLLGWKLLRAALVETHAPEELVQTLGLGWHFGGVAMLAFGGLVLMLFSRRLRGVDVSLMPAIVIGVTYVVFGAGAFLFSGFDPFFLDLHGSRCDASCRVGFGARGVTPLKVVAVPLVLAVLGAAHCGSTRRDAKGIEQVWVPAGSFVMGTDDATLEQLKAQKPPPWVMKALDGERPQHTVRLTEGFWIDKYEVTNAAFRAFVDDGGYTTPAYWSEGGLAWLGRQKLDTLPSACPGDRPEDPRRCVTWYEAEAYARWRGGRLPTEAEWEYAARGPKSPRYPWGDEFDAARCNVVDTTGSVPVGSYPNGASWVGALDMSGNAMEWVADWLDVTYYAHSPVDDPPGPASGTVKVEKGGWWGSNPFVARSAYRHYEDPPEYGDKHIGFRIMSGRNAGAPRD